MPNDSPFLSAPQFIRKHWFFTLLVLLVAIDYLFVPNTVSYPGGIQVETPIQQGEPVIVSGMSCYNDLLTSSSQLYVIHVTRRVVNDDTGERISVPDLDTPVRGGCQDFHQAINYIPGTLAPGHYHIEGTSTPLWTMPPHVRNTTTWIIPEFEITQK